MRKYIASQNEYGEEVFTIPSHVVSFGGADNKVVFYTSDGNKHFVNDLTLNQFVEALNRELTNYYDRS